MPDIKGPGEVILSPRIRHTLVKGGEAQPPGLSIFWRLIC